MESAFILSDEKIRKLIQSYFIWEKSSPSNHKFLSNLEEQEEYIRSSLLDVSIIENISHKELYKRIYEYSRTLESQAYVRLSESKIRRNLKNLKRNLLYLIESDEEPLFKCKQILEMEFKIPAFQIEFWSPILHAAHPEEIPFWNSQAENFLKKIGIDIKTEKKTFDEKLEELFSAMHYLRTIDPQISFKQLNHLSFFAAKVEEGKEQIEKLKKEQKISYWIFQSEQERFDLILDLKFGNRKITWNVNQHKQDISIGDKVIMWVKGKNSGCFALAEVESNLYELSNEFGDHQVDILIEDNFVHSPITKDRLKNNPVFAGFKGDEQGTNLSATKEQFIELKNFKDRTEKRFSEEMENSVLKSAIQKVHQEMFANQEQIHSINKLIRKYSGLFKLKSLSSLTKEEIQKFFDKEHNILWNVFQIEPPEIKPDFMKFIQILAILLKEDDPLEDKIKYLQNSDKKDIFDQIGHHVICFILFISNPEKYGIFNAETETGLKNSGIYPVGLEKLDYYRKYTVINKTLLKISSDFFIPLWAVHLIWKHIEKQDKYSLESVRENDLNPVHHSHKGILTKHIMDDIFIGAEEFENLIEVLKYKKNIILQGVGGVGKSFLSKRIADMITISNDNIMMITLTDHTSYENLIIDRKDDIYGIFVQFCNFAAKKPAESFVLLIDQMNRRNLDDIFGETVSLLENDKRGVEYQIFLKGINEEPFMVPENLYIIGTKNTLKITEESHDLLFERRFALINLYPAFEKPAFKNYLLKFCENDLIEKIIGNFSELNRVLQNVSGNEFMIGHSYFCPTKDQTCDHKWYQNIIDFEIVPLLYHFWKNNREKALEEIKKLKLES